LFYFVTAAGCFVALARGDLIIISPMGQVVNIIFQVFCYFFESFCLAIKNPSVYAGLRHFYFFKTNV